MALLSGTAGDENHNADEVLLRPSRGGTAPRECCAERNKRHESPEKNQVIPNGKFHPELNVCRDECREENGADHPRQTLARGCDRASCRARGKRRESAKNKACYLHLERKSHCRFGYGITCKAEAQTTVE